MDRKEIEAVVRAVLAAVFKRQFETVVDVTRQNTLGWDSLKHIELMFALEEALGVEFFEEELSQLDSVEKIIAAAEVKYEA